MTYLVTGIGSTNKGAELMLLTIMQQVRRFDAQAVMVIGPGSGPYEWRAKMGLRQLFDPERSGRLSWIRTRLLHSGYRKRFGLVLPEEIDIVLDASGFAFGDQWKPEWIEGAARFLERYKRLGARIVLLPQAFGPFRVRRVREAVTRILGVSDLVFARDHESQAYCHEITRLHESIRLGRDFTNLISGYLPSDWVPHQRHVAIVPNRQMLVHGPEERRAAYVTLLSNALSFVAASGYRPFVLVHESDDCELASLIATGADMPNCVVCHDNPLELKGILGTCAFSIGSRFHGLVSALSQSVPCISTSWTHKYRQLFDDYGVREWADVWNDGDASWTAKLETLLIVSTQETLRQHLRERAAFLQEDAKSTWAAIETLLMPVH